MNARQPLKLNSKLPRTQQLQHSRLMRFVKCISCRVTHLLTHSFIHSLTHAFICALIPLYTHSCMHACTKNVSAPGAWHTQRQGQEVSHFDLLEGLFRLIQILQRDAHLVVQLGQPPVIRLHHIRPRQVAIMSYGCT